MKENVTDAIRFFHCSVRGSGEIFAAVNAFFLTLNRLEGAKWTSQTRFILCTVVRASRTVCYIRNNYYMLASFQWQKARKFFVVTALLIEQLRVERFGLRYNDFKVAYFV